MNPAAHSSSLKALQAENAQLLQRALTDVLGRIPTHPHKKVGDLLPHHWKIRNV